MSEITMCSHCKKNPAQSGRMLCKACCNKTAELKKKLKQKRYDAGLCVYCGKNPRQNGRTMCFYCNVIHAEKERMRYWEKKAKR